MELEEYVNNLREQLALAAEAGGEDARALADRLTAPLDSAIRLMLLNVLDGATAEISRDLAPGSVELRLRGGEPEFVVTPAPTEPQPLAGEAPHDASDGWPVTAPAAATAPATSEGAVARINLRLPEQLKRGVEQAAEREGLSINAWLVRAVAAAVEPRQASTRSERDHARGGQRYTGWGR
jgi:HicB family